MNKTVASALAHQFDDLDQQHRADELGMWLFLSTEVLFFGGMFLTYAVYRVHYEAAFAAGSELLDIMLGTVNTGVLLCSSLMMALAVDAAARGDRRRTIGFLAATMLLGAAFLGVKGYEYYVKYEHGLMPLLGLPFEFDGPSAPHVRLFLQLYFLLTGVHALHMLAGLTVLLVLLIGALRGRFLGEHASPVHIAGLYWHFVDVVWVFLYPLLYLIGVHPI
jgi:cytochrome c oxidase subunit 3